MTEGMNRLGQFEVASKEGRQVVICLHWGSSSCHCLAKSDFSLKKADMVCGVCAILCVFSSHLPDVPPDGALRQRRRHLRTGSTEQHHFGRVAVHHVEEQLRPHCHVTLQNNDNDCINLRKMRKIKNFDMTMQGDDD